MSKQIRRPDHSGPDRRDHSRPAGAPAGHDEPRDDDPSGMTDFEKNATLGELEQIDDSAPAERGSGG